MVERGRENGTEVLVVPEHSAGLYAVASRGTAKSNNINEAKVSGTVNELLNR